MAHGLEGFAVPRELARAGRMVARLARGPAEVEAAQRLRWRVFAQELGARLRGPVAGLDQDPFDPFCEHLIVVDEDSGAIVGTYRLMFPEPARRAGGLYTQGEFVTDRLAPIRGELVELGRSCVDPVYRTGTAIMLLWAGLGELLGALPYRYLVGCASVPAADGGRYAASLWRRLWATHAAPEAWRVFPRERLDVDALAHDIEVVVPPLIKGYLRAGGRLLGEPHVDRDFGCADLPILVALDGMDGRYARRFVRRA